MVGGKSGRRTITQFGTFDGLDCWKAQHDAFAGQQSKIKQAIVEALETMAYVFTYLRFD